MKKHQDSDIIRPKEGNKKMINILLDFVKNAGNYLIQQQKTIKPLLNKDSSVCSVVTQADLYVSDLFEQTLKTNFSDLNHMIIDEEKITKYGDDIFNKINLIRQKKI